MAPPYLRCSCNKSWRFAANPCALALVCFRCWQWGWSSRAAQDKTGTAHRPRQRTFLLARAGAGYKYIAPACASRSRGVSQRSLVFSASGARPGGHGQLRIYSLSAGLSASSAPVPAPAASASASALPLLSLLSLLSLLPLLPLSRPIPRLPCVS